MHITPNPEDPQIDNRRTKYLQTEGSDICIAMYVAFSGTAHNGDHP